MSFVCTFIKQTIQRLCTLIAYPYCLWLLSVIVVIFLVLLFIHIGLIATCCLFLALVKLFSFCDNSTLWLQGVFLLSLVAKAYTVKSSRFSISFGGISWLGSVFIFLQWFKRAHIYIQVSTVHNGSKQRIDKQNFKRLSTPCLSPSKICWSIPYPHCGDYLLGNSICLKQHST